jgi:hypothetical protein
LGPQAAVDCPLNPFRVVKIDDSPPLSDAILVDFNNYWNAVILVRPPIPQIEIDSFHGTDFHPAEFDWRPLLEAGDGTVVEENESLLLLKQRA